MSVRLDGVEVSAYLSNVVKKALVRSGHPSFWSTPERSQSDPTVEVLEINLNGERLINYLSFQLAHFPHLVSAEWYDREVGAWEPLRAGERPIPPLRRPLRLANKITLRPSEQGEPLRHQIADSMPVQVGTADSNAALSSTLLVEHPQHHGADHWVPVSWKAAPVTTSRIRLLLVRSGGVPPARVTGGASAYSLGVKGLQIGYRVNSKGDIPSAAEITGTTFGSSVDMLGSRVTFSLRAQKAAGVLAPDEGSAWRSEPQPVNYAVVNFYVDTRTGPQDPTTGQPMPGDADTTGALPGGLGQVIDRFYIDPLTVGAHVNLYHSNDEPTGEFRALDEPLAYPIAQEHGSITTGSLDPSVTTADVMDYSATASTFTDIDNTYLQFSPHKAWWLGLDLLSRTDGLGMAGGVDDHPWFSFGGNTLRQIGSTIEFVTATGKVASLAIDDDHMVNAPFQVSVVFNPEAPAGLADENYPKGLTLTYRFADREPVEVTRDVRPEDLGPGLPTTVSIGRYNDATAPGIPALGMRSLVLKIEKPVERDQVLDFFEYPRGFSRRPDSVLLDQGLTDNALLRAHASFASPGVNPAGLVGGPGDRYAEMTWTPVFRDYVLRKGLLHIPPTRAKYWKFEFTQLVAEHYESFVPIRRAVKLFPSKVVEAHAALATGKNWTPKNPGTSGIKTALDLSDVNRYADAVGLLREASVDTSRSHTATEALYVPDPGRAAEIAKYGWIWSYQPWHIGATSPRFTHTQRHEYETVTVAHSTKIGFFAGLKALQAYRLDYLIDDDTEQYDEHFHDQVHIDAASDVAWQENRVSTYSSSATVTSKAFNSKRPVRGIQFASVQSDAFSLLPDEGFRDEDLLKHWREYGDASLQRLPDRTVRVNRGWSQRTYGDIETQPALDTYANMEGRLYGELEGDLPNGLAGGGITSEAVTPSASGRVYAAARVAASEALAGPVTLEIVSVNGDTVLASAERSVTAGQEESFHISYRVGSAIDRLAYADIEGDLYGGLDGTTYASHETVAIDGDVYARLTQPGRFDDAFLVKRLSLFDAALTWEFSNDDGATWWDGTDVRNNPEGVLTFPTDGTKLRWRMRSFHPNVSVSALSMRPWYGGLLGAVPGRAANHVLGPNRSVVDDYPDIHQDPMWQQSDSPIPAYWFLPAPPEPVFVPPPPPPEPPGPEFYLEAQSLLVSERSGTWQNPATGVYEPLPDEGPYYPFGPAATAALDDGSFFVAVQMFPNSSGTGDGFIRMWHLSPNLVVLGTHDEPWGVTTSAMGNAHGIALGVEDGKVMLLLDTTDGDSDTYDYGDSLDRSFDTGTAIDTSAVPADTTLTKVGTNPSLNQFYWGPSSYVQIAATNSAAMASTRLDPVVIADGLTIKKATMRLNFVSDAAVPATATWKISDSRQPYGSGVLASGTGLGAMTYTANNWTQYMDVPLALTDAQLASLAEPLAAGAIQFSFSPGTSGTRKVAGMLLRIDYGRNL